MDELKTYIEDLLNIPYIEEGQAVMDGSFCLSPYITTSLIGDGQAQSVVLYVAVDIFYKDKNDNVNNGLALYKALLAENNFCCENPDFTYEQEANMWRTTMIVQEVLNE